MQARAAVFNIVRAAVNPDIPAAHVIGSGGFDSPTVDGMFIVVRFSTSDGWVGVGNHGPTNCQVWAYDNSSSYLGIDAMHQRIITAMNNAVHVLGSDGVTLTQADFISASEDLYDDGYKAVTRNVVFRTIAR